LVQCALFSLILVDDIGWGTFLSWYGVVAFGVVGRQFIFKFLLSQQRRALWNLRVIAWLLVITGSMAIAVLPLFADALSVSEIAVMSAIMVGWVITSVAVLWVEPNIYAVYVAFNMSAIFLTWVGHAEPTSLLLLAFALTAGSILTVNFSRLVSRQHGELERVTASRGRLLAAANHDLRQPVHALSLFMSRLKESPTDKSLIAGVDASVNALMGMLDVYFDYSRLESKAQSIRVEIFPIQKILDQLQLNFSEVAVKSGTRLIIHPCRVSVQSDAMLLHRILLNLVGNAIKFSEGGTVLVCCRLHDAGRAMRIDVLDNGVGIDPQHHKKIFEEFFQSDNSARNREKGIGLGLSIVNEACKLLKHPLTLRSGLGKGSRFSVTVPVEHLNARRQNGVAKKDTRLGSSEDVVILLVEDDPLGAAALSALLESWGYAVHVAPDGKTACTLLESMPHPDLVICDYRLPGDSNGVETVQRLRQISGSLVPALIISGDSGGSVQSDTTEAGLTLLQKPFAPAKMRSWIEIASAGARQ
jgi:signal transduction histidine kinase/CheY-like chemotaxis protein